MRRRILIALAVLALLSPTMARAQDPTATPTPTSTPTFTPSPTLDIWQPVMVGTNQAAALEYSITAGDGFHITALLIGIALLALLCLLELKGKD